MLGVTTEILANLSPNPTTMRLRLEDGNGLIHAESLSFFLSEKMARPEAQALVKAFCIKAAATNRSLASIAAERLPDVDLSAVFVDGGLGQGPAEARAFVARARSVP
jgi:3-carboxy-cis,cis-muconate cycloisomerase